MNPHTWWAATGDSYLSLVYIEDAAYNIYIPDSAVYTYQTAEIGRHLAAEAIDPGGGIVV